MLNGKRENGEEKNKEKFYAFLWFVRLFSPFIYIFFIVLFNNVYLWAAISYIDIYFLVLPFFLRGCFIFFACLVSNIFPTFVSVSNMLQMLRVFLGQPKQFAFE